MVPTLFSHICLPFRGRGLNKGGNIIAEGKPEDVTKIKDSYTGKFLKNLLDTKYLPNFTAGLTFFIAVAATNLFHQGNWQRVYAAKDNKVLKKSLVISFLITIPVVFLMGFSGLIAVSSDSKVIPDLAFFSLLLKEQTISLSIIIIILGISLTISSIDTLINAISSLVVVDGKSFFISKRDYLVFSKYIIILLSIIAFIVASKGLSILYLFLLADLFSCIYVTVFTIYVIFSRYFCSISNLENKIK